MINKLVKGLFKVIILLSLVLLVIKLFEPFFTESETSVWDNFYAQEKNSVDILILGNSHANAGIDQNILQAKLNSNVVSLATRGQNIYQTYYCALEAYKNQVPEVLIIENYLFYERLTMDAFVNQDPTINDYMKRYLTFEGKKIGEVKIEEARAFFKGNLLENLFPLIKKHDRWTDVDEIKKRLKTKGKKERRRGVTILSQASVQEYKTRSEFNLNTYNILPEEEKALQQIVDLAKEKGTKKIILLTIPFYNHYRNKIDYNSLDKPLKAFVKKNEFVNYLDLNIEYPDLDRSCFSNEPVGYNQHLNYKGAIVVSNYLSNYVYNTYKLKSNNNDNNSLESALYKSINSKPELTKSEEFLGFFRINNSKNKIVSITQEKQAIILDGWMTLKDKKSTDNEMFIGLVKGNNFMYINSVNQLVRKKRLDVTKNLKKKNNLYDDSGFKFSINSALLEKGLFDVYTIIRDPKGKIFVKKSGRKVKII
ncbi:hypothetical protein [Formosa sp. L2A11]|uniref:hypothetical protein n=1 Tax=Formosa sp. L2A11 TaxID=2686363 RepID=UPI00131C36F9|nr:hypothetical protein [Formosa sp. L2A11]